MFPYLYFFPKHLFTVSECSCRNVVAFLFIQSTAFSCPDIRYLHGTSNPYPPPRLILFPVTLVSKNDPGRVKNKEIHLDIAKGIWPTTLSSYITATALHSCSFPGSRVQLYVSPSTRVQIC